MALDPGTRIGAYEITSALGAGGMGEVYRARDTRLKREVALKILPPSVASDPDRVARFQREAEVLAALNHPNIAQIYGVEVVDGTLALVMELVEGEDLAVRIARGPIPVAEALADCATDGGGPGRGARTRHHSPRPEARQHQASRRTAP